MNFVIRLTVHFNFECRALPPVNKLELVTRVRGLLRVSRGASINGDALNRSRKPLRSAASRGKSFANATAMST